MPGLLIGVHTASVLKDINDHIPWTCEFHGLPTIEDYLIHMGTWRMTYFKDTITTSVCHTVLNEESEDQFIYMKNQSVIITGLFIRHLFTIFNTWSVDETLNPRVVRLQEIMDVIPMPLSDINGMPHY